MHDEVKVRANCFVVLLDFFTFQASQLIKAAVNSNCLTKLSFSVGYVSCLW